MGMDTLHPRYATHAFRWRAETRDVNYMPGNWTIMAHPDYQQSPVHHMRSGGVLWMRHRLDAEDGYPFPILGELRAEGFTDYAARIVPYDPDLAAALRDGRSHATTARGLGIDGVFLSCATDHPGGFDDDQLTQVFDALPFLAICIKSRLTFDVASTLLETYIGRAADEKVLTGSIERGLVETIRGRDLVRRPPRVHAAGR